MDEINHYQMEADAAFGQFLIETMAKHYNCEAKEEAINRQVYKNTACGAWIKFDSKGIKVGSIVEGSEAEFCERVNVFCEDDYISEGELIHRVESALDYIESLVDEEISVMQEDTH